MSTGTGEKQLCFPTGVAVAGSIFFVADTLNHRIVRFDAETLNWMDSFGEEGKEINHSGPGGQRPLSFLLPLKEEELDDAEEEDDVVVVVLDAYEV